MITQLLIDFYAWLMSSIIVAFPEVELNSMLGEITSGLDTVFGLLESSGAIVPWVAISSAPVFLGFALSVWTTVIVFRLTMWVVNR